MTTPTEDHKTHEKAILQHLKTYGQRMDSEIASTTHISIAAVRTCIAELATQGEISSCSVIRFDGNREIKGTLCRIVGFIPPSSPGRKVGAST